MIKYGKLVQFVKNTKRNRQFKIAVVQGGKPNTPEAYWKIRRERFGAADAAIPNFQLHKTEMATFISHNKDIR